MSTKVIRKNDDWTSVCFEDLPIGEQFTFCDEQNFDSFRICCKISENSAIAFDNNFPKNSPILKVSAEEDVYTEDVEIYLCQFSQTGELLD